MRIMKRILLTVLCLNVEVSFSQDYFNPMFLGEDVSSLEDLSYITSGNNISPGSYYLYLYVGDDFIRNINIKFVSRAGKVQACFTKEIVDSIPFNDTAKSNINYTGVDLNECIDVKKYIKEFDYDMDLSKLIIRLSVPQVYLDATRTTLASQDDWDAGIPVFLMNYNFNGSYSKNNDYDDYSSHYFNVNNRINLGAWRFNSNSYYNENRVGSRKNNELKTGNIYLSRGINSIKSHLMIGQNILGSNLFDSNPYVGVTLGTSNEMLPDSDRGYSPAIRGIVDSRSKLTIKQNNNIIYQTYINPGPYDINNLNSVGTSGDYEVELTSAEGIKTQYRVPYSSLPNLLRPGKYNYSISLGKLDLNSAHNDNFAQGTVSIGMPLKVTAFIGQQISNNYISTALGVGKDLGGFGALSVDTVHAISKIDDDKLTGESFRILYAKLFNETGTNIQLTGYRYSTSNYYTLSEASYRNNASESTNINRRKNSFQVNLTQTLNSYGQLYVWGNIDSYWGNDSKTKNIQIGWNKTFNQLNNVMVSASYNKNINNGVSDNMFYLSFSMPISNASSPNKMYLSNSMAYNKKNYNNLTSLYGAALDDKLEYNLYQVVNKESNSNNTNLNLNYKANSVNIYAGSTYSSKSKEIDYGASGGVLFHQDGVVFTREANDTAILVEAKGAPGARVNRNGENIVIDNSGYALIPYATPYHYNDIELDPATFGNGYNVENKILKISPTRGAIGKVTFDVLKGYNFLVSVKNDNKLIKFGTLVHNNSDKTISIANDDGTVYLTGVKNNSTYTVKWNENTTCSFTVDYQDESELTNINKIQVDCL